MSTNSYECEFCAKVFARHLALNEHLNIHLNRKPFECVSCGQTFRHSSTLARHSLIHSKHSIDLVKFACNICSRQFDRKCYLKSHLLSHDTIKTRLCHICGHTFKYQCDLTRHLKIHDSYKHYKCDVCHYEFNDRSSMKRHHNKLHKQSIPNVTSTQTDINNNHINKINVLNISKSLEIDVSSDTDTDTNNNNNGKRDGNCLSDSTYLNWCVDYISVCRILPKPLPSQMFTKLVDLQREIALHLEASDSRSQCFNVLKTAIQDLNAIIYEHLQNKNKT